MDGLINKLLTKSLLIFFYFFLHTANLLAANNKLILFVWDGLRPDVISQENTPNLFHLKKEGTYFSDHHSSYPTVTMNNANSLATGNYSGDTGFYGNKVWRPDISSNIINFKQPVFVQEHMVLKDLEQKQNPLMYVNTLIELARKNGLKTAGVGKSGPVALQDGHSLVGDNIVISEYKIYPLAFAKKLQQKGYSLPKDIINIYDHDAIVLDTDNGHPTKQTKVVKAEKFKDNNGSSILLNNLSDPSKADSAIYKDANKYMMDIYLNEVLLDYNPDISIIWLREPDTTSHKYGPGSKPFYKALKNQDKLLGKLLVKLKDNNLLDKTNIMLVSDHGHSNISGNFDYFPLRKMKNGKIKDFSSDGYSTSGYVRLADLLTKAGFRAYDGLGCVYNPALSGITNTNNVLYKPLVDHTGEVCGEEKGFQYTTKSHKVPDKYLESNNTVIIANNGGSAYLYVPSKDPVVIKSLVRYLQSRQEIGAVFIDHKYGDLPGTLPMYIVRFNDTNKSRHPDVLVAMTHDEHQVVQGLPGTIYSSSKYLRGSHGSLSPIDIHNTLIAHGPDFKKQYVNGLPSANVDVPVTIAHLFGLSYNNKTIGRPLLEAIENSGVKPQDYVLNFTKLQPSKPAMELSVYGIIDRDNTKIDKNLSNYTYVLNMKELYLNKNKYVYLDSGKSIRY